MILGNRPCLSRTPVAPSPALLTFVQPSMQQRLPPPCAAQKFLSRAPLVHPGYVHRRPPPCAMQNLVLPCAHLVQPGNWQCRAPVCSEQYGDRLAVGWLQLSVLQTLRPPFATLLLFTEGMKV
jgi:hypothetical protein